MESRYINRYHSYVRSLDILEQSCGADPGEKFVLGATAQAFNLTFDLSWKVMKDILVKYFAIQDFASGSPRETLRAAYSAGLISDDRWVQMLRIRNTLAHDYDGEVTLKYFHMIVTDFYQLFCSLKDKIQPYYEEDRLKTADKLSEI